MLEGGKYREAHRILVRAERLWMLNVSKQTMKSRFESCEQLLSVLHLIDNTSRHCSLELNTDDYRKIVEDLRGFFSEALPCSRNYREIYSSFLEQRKRFHREIRLGVDN